MSKREEEGGKEREDANRSEAVDFCMNGWESAGPYVVLLAPFTDWCLLVRVFDFVF
jgi:hypothetical protein